MNGDWREKNWSAGSMSLTGAVVHPCEVIDRPGSRELADSWKLNIAGGKGASNLSWQIWRSDQIKAETLIYNFELKNNRIFLDVKNALWPWPLPVRLAGGWWLVLVCSERKVLLAGCWLICSERKILLAASW
jgi:hypothetical protein